MSNFNTTKVAVVTGSNKGIGYAIVKGLCGKFVGDVYLTARNENLGLNAVKSLNELGYYPKFYVLDVTDYDNIIRFREHIAQKYGGIDILVNNAAIKIENVEPFSLRAKETIRVNYLALKNVCNILFPILKSHARVVNVSSSAGHLSRIPGTELRKQFSSENLTEPKLTELINSFLKTSESNSCVEFDGWPNNAYVVSKVAVSALTVIQQREFNKDSCLDIIVNAVHPGLVKTDMTRPEIPLLATLIPYEAFSEERGAEAPLFASLLPENVSEPKGAYIWHNKEIIDWVNGTLPALA